MDSINLIMAAAGGPADVGISTPALHLAEYVSLILTIPTILLAFWVCRIFGPKAYRSLKNKGWDELTESELLIIGITIGFMGSAMDNVYWGIAWSASFLELHSMDFWFKHGVLNNIPFRQCAGILAAVCHIAAGFKYTIKNTKVCKAVLSITLATILGMIALFWMKDVS